MISDDKRHLAVASLAPPGLARSLVSGASRILVKVGSSVATRQKGTACPLFPPRPHPSRLRGPPDRIHSG